MSTVLDFPTSTREGRGGHLRLSGPTRQRALVASATRDGGVRAFSAKEARALVHPDPAAFNHQPYGPHGLVVDDGHVYGHVALFGVEHLSYSGEKIYAPKSQTDYGPFYGLHPDVPQDEGYGPTVVCSDGSKVNVGTIFVDSVHPSLRSVASDTQAHYHDTGTAAAKVAVWETEFGIWVSGVCHPGLTEEQLFTLQTSDTSGDWRRIDGHLELVAVLSVNLGGFNKYGGNNDQGDEYARVASGGLSTQVALVASAGGDVEGMRVTTPRRTFDLAMARFRSRVAADERAFRASRALADSLVAAGTIADVPAALLSVEERAARAANIFGVDDRPARAAVASARFAVDDETENEDEDQGEGEDVDQGDDEMSDTPGNEPDETGTGVDDTGDDPGTDA